MITKNYLTTTIKEILEILEAREVELIDMVDYKEKLLFGKDYNYNHKFLELESDIKAYRELLKLYMIERSNLDLK